MDMLVQSDLVYQDYFVLSNNVSLARYADDWKLKYKELNSFQSKCQQCKHKQRWPYAVQ